MAELDRPGDVGWNGSKSGANAERVSETRAATAATDGIYGIDASQDGQLEESLIVGFRYGNGEGSLLELWIRLCLWRGVLGPPCALFLVLLIQPLLMSIESLIIEDILLVENE
jgi:hypothetical protein